MDTPSPLALAAAVLTAPGWVRVGIAAPSERMCEAEALELGTILAVRLEHAAYAPPGGQLPLPL